MQARHRKTHLRIWICLIVFVGILLVAAIATRQERPPFAHEKSAALSNPLWQTSLALYAEKAR